MKTFLVKKSIGFKFLTATGLVLAIGTLLLSVAIAINEGFAQYDLLVKKGTGLAQYIAKISQYPLEMKDTLRLDDIVSEARYDGDILYTVISDSNGRTVTSRLASINNDSPRITELRPTLRNINELDRAMEYIREHEAAREVSAPITAGNQTIGTVVVCMSKHNIIDNIVSTITHIIIFNIVMAAILTITLYIVARRLILTPLAGLIDASHLLAKGDLTTRVATPAVGEIGMLLASFNTMAEELQQTTVSREYVDNIIRSMTEALLVLSPNARVMDVNQAACRLFGYEEDELVGMGADRLFDTTILAGISDTTNPENGLCVDTICTRKDGETLPILFTASAMRDSNGTFRRIVCNALDITEMKQVCQQLETTNAALKQEIFQRTRAQEEARLLNLDLEEQKSALEHANRELESFCYSVSHDLRAPLRHINGFTTMLREECLDGMNEFGRDCLERICAASSHMGLLIDDLLRFSRVSRARLTIEEVNLSAVAARIAASYRELDPERQVRFDIAPDLTARGDAPLLEMMLQNLMDNAWKYSAAKPESLIVVGRTDLEGEEFFFVRDNGVGFDMAYREKLFKVFERLHGEEFDGTGIGLATVQRIVERHGGRIWADGTIGAGATFYFTLT